MDFNFILSIPLNHSEWSQIQNCNQGYNRHMTQGAERPLDIQSYPARESGYNDIPI